MNRHIPLLTVLLQDNIVCRIRKIDNRDTLALGAPVQIVTSFLLMLATSLTSRPDLSEGDWVLLDHRDYPELVDKKLKLEDVQPDTCVVLLDGNVDDYYEVPTCGLTPLMSAVDSQRLVVLEAVVSTGLHAFVEVGKALAEIRDSKLYRLDYSNFKDYCSEVWGLEERRAYQILEASEVVEGLQKLKNFSVLPNESQARVLKSIPAETRPEIWETTLQLTGNKPTARVVEQVAAPVQPEPEITPVDCDGKPLHERDWVVVAGTDGPVYRIAKMTAGIATIERKGRTAGYPAGELQLSEPPGKVSAQVSEPQPDDKIAKPYEIGGSQNELIRDARNRVFEEFGLDPKTGDTAPKPKTQPQPQNKRTPRTSQDEPGPPAPPIKAVESAEADEGDSRAVSDPPLFSRGDIVTAGASTYCVGGVEAGLVQLLEKDISSLCRWTQQLNEIELSSQATGLTLGALCLEHLGVVVSAYGFDLVEETLELLR